MSFTKRILYFFVKKSSEKSHRIYYKQKNNYYINQYIQCTQKKSPSKIRKETHELWKYWKIYPIQYFRYNMYRSDCPLSISEMKNYIPDYFAYYLLYPKSFKERNILCEDKFLFYTICQGLRINQPKTILYTRNNSFLNDQQNIITLQETLEIIQNIPDKKLFIKPRFGVGGTGIHVLNKTNPNTFIDKQKNVIVDLEYIKEIVKQDYIIQAGLTQHTIINEIYPFSINTFRIVTECIDNSKIKILFALLRMGHGGMEIDNATSGGLYTKVNPNTGELYKYALTNNQEKFLAHPYTNFKFEGFHIPFWDKIVEFTLKLAFKFCDIKYIGWDIAYTEDGPVVIEANNGPDISILQDFYGGLKNHFKINSPTDFWYSENYGIKDL